MLNLHFVRAADREKIQKAHQVPFLKKNKILKVVPFDHAAVYHQAQSGVWVQGKHIRHTYASSDSALHIQPPPPKN